jgi:hypothetical protein
MPLVGAAERGLPLDRQAAPSTRASAPEHVAAENAVRIDELCTLGELDRLLESPHTRRLLLLRLLLARDTDPNEPHCFRREMVERRCGGGRRSA